MSDSNLVSTGLSMYHDIWVHVTMGVSLSWVAIEGKSGEEVHRHLGLTDTGARGDFLAYPIAGLDLRNGWYLVMADECDHKTLSDRVTESLSCGASVVGCSVEERLLYSSAMLWRQGKRIWRVQHRGAVHGIMDLVIEGQPPDGFYQLRDEYWAKQVSAGGAQAGADLIFEIPLALAKFFVGVHHDEPLSDVEADTWHVLTIKPNGLLAEATKSWWRTR
ncbi:MAG: hypothetical protein H8K08_14140 [Nitrospira sp.]|nr:hypothetical protein [Nitrospira sp.]